MKRIAILASGSGTNAENIIRFFQLKKTAVVTQLLCNKPYAKVFERCIPLKTNCLYFDKTDFLTTNRVLNHLKDQADFIVLAGFLWKVPQKIIEAFPNKIINIHPALLPKYGGKGMYGMHVHQEVKKNNEKETGITIHFVNENYDDGAIIFQAKTMLSPEDTPENIAEKVHQLEYKHYPEILEKVITSDG